MQYGYILEYVQCDRTWFLEKMKFFTESNEMRVFTIKKINLTKKFQTRVMIV